MTNAKPGLMSPAEVKVRVINLLLSQFSRFGKLFFVRSPGLPWHFGSMAQGSRAGTTVDL